MLWYRRQEEKTTQNSFKVAKYVRGRSSYGPRSVRGEVCDEGGPAGGPAGPDGPDGGDQGGKDGVGAQCRSDRQEGGIYRRRTKIGRGLLDRRAVPILHFRFSADTGGDEGDERHRAEGEATVTGEGHVDEVWGECDCGESVLVEESVLSFVAFTR